MRSNAEDEALAIDDLERTARRTEDFQAVMDDVEAELAEDHFSTAFGKLREAVNLSRGFPALEEKAVNMALDKAGQLLPRSWRIAESLLLEVAEVDSKRATPQALWSGIQQCEREQTISNALHAADLASSSGAIRMAQRRLAMLAAQYPGESRLLTRLAAMEAKGRQQAEREITAVKAAPEPGRVVAAKARKFEQSGLFATCVSAASVFAVTGALILMHNTDSAYRPMPGKATIPAARITPLLSNTMARTPQLREVARAQRPTFKAAEVKAANRGTKLFSTAFLPKPSVPSLSQPAVTGDAYLAPPALEDSLPLDGGTSAAQLLAAADLENRIKADRALLAMRRAEGARQSAAVLEVVRQYAAAWSARNVDSIVSLHRDLDRRTVKTQLSSLKSLAMNITPASEPRIEGERATIQCERQVSQVFEDGVRKQTPAQKVTFVMAKRNGAWTIESAK